MELVLQQHLPHQQKAVDAVIDVFKGVNMTAPVQFFENPAFLLDDKQLWKNIETLQRNIPQEYRSNGFDPEESCLNLDIKMETGTGKTYVYTKTIFEMHQKYGFNKRTQLTDYHIDTAWRLDDAELADIHAKNQPISAGEVVNKVKNMIRELYDESISIELKRIEVVSSFQKGKMVSDKMTSLGDYEFGDLTGIGGYGIEAYPTLDGVPIIASAGSGYLEKGAEKIYSVLYFSTPMISAFYCSDDYMNISLSNVFKKKEVVFENVPLCGFDKVYEIVEKYVDEGKIKRVYNISLGYIIYLDKKEEYSDKKEKNGKQRDYADYLLIPTWIIGCSYSENGSNNDQTDMNSYDGSEQQDLNFQKIFIDAQTGKLHDPKEVGSERYYADLH